MTKEEKQSPEAGDSLKTAKTTLKKQGAVLPLGFPDGNGGYARDIALRPWRMAEEKELGKLRSENENASMGQFVTMILATMCTKIGHHNLDAMKFAERQVVISQMFMGDVFYAYMWLRAQNLGAILELELICPFCKTKHPFDADLETTEVVVADSIEAASWEQALKFPFEIRGEKVTGLKMAPPRWATMEAIGDTGADSGSAKSGIIAGSVCGFTGKDTPVSITEGELNEMMKYDIEMLTRGVEDYDMGPNMAVDVKCPRCKREAVHPMNWGYDNFFGISSR